MDDKEFIGNATLEGLGYTLGTAAFGSIEAHEDPL